VLIFGSMAFGISTFVFYIYAGHSKPVLLLLCALMGISIGITAAVPYVMVRAFPACVRFTGVSFSFNLSYAIVGGSTPVMIAWVAQTDVMAYAYYLLFIALLAFCIGVYLWRHGEGLGHDPGLEESPSRL